MGLEDIVGHRDRVGGLGDTRTGVSADINML